MRTLLISFVMLCLALPAAGQPFDSSWTASSGELPNQSCQYTLIDTSGFNPVLQPNYLRLETLTLNRFMGYEHKGTRIQMPSQLVVDARIRFNGGTSNAVNQTGCGIVIEPVPDETIILYLEEGGIFLLATPSTRGEEAAVATSDDFHDYRITVDVATGAVQVFYDGVLTLEGETYRFTASDGSPSIYWGDPGNAAAASSDWMWLQHNAATVACGTPVGTEALSWGSVKGMFPDDQPR